MTDLLTSCKFFYMLFFHMKLSQVYENLHESASILDLFYWLKCALFQVLAVIHVWKEIFVEGATSASFAMIMIYVQLATKQARQPHGIQQNIRCSASLLGLILVSEVLKTLFLIVLLLPVAGYIPVECVCVCVYVCVCVCVYRHNHHQSVLPKGKSFTASSGT